MVNRVNTRSSDDLRFVATIVMERRDLGSVILFAGCNLSRYSSSVRVFRLCQVIIVFDLDKYFNLKNSFVYRVTA